MFHFAFRLATILIAVSVFPPGAMTPARGASAMCATMAAFCFLFATSRREAVADGLNHWHEAAGLAGMAVVFGLFF